MLGINSSNFDTISFYERATLNCWQCLEADFAIPGLLAIMSKYAKECMAMTGSVTVAGALQSYVEHIEV